jgi:anti-anti-sigma factor
MLSEPFEIERTNDTVVACVRTAHVELADAQQLVAELTECIRYENARFFVLDLSEVDVLASACLSNLITFAQDLEHVHGRLVLANCRPTVTTVIKITGLDSLLAMYDDVEAATAKVIHG